MVKVAGVILVLLAALAPAAAAKSPNPGGASAVDQYAEQIPTASGSTTTPSGKAGDERPAAVVATAIARRGGGDKHVLTSIAVSRPASAPGPRATKRPAAPTAVAAPGTPRGSGDGGGTSLAWLIAGLAGVTALGLGAAYARRN